MLEISVSQKNALMIIADMIKAQEQRLKCPIVKTNDKCSVAWDSISDSEEFVEIYDPEDGYHGVAM